MRITETDAPDALTLLRDQWQALQAQCPQATPYQTWEWNAAWWRQFGSRKRLRLLLFREQADGPLIGIAPLYTSPHLATPIRRLAWIGTGASDYLGLLARPDYADEIAQAFLRRVERELRGWDMADLQQLRADTPLLAHAPTPRTRSDTDRQTLLPMEPCPYLALPAHWDAFATRLGKKMRSNLGYYDRLLTKTYQRVEYSLADAATVDEGMTALFDLHQQRWNARWLPGVLGNRRVQGFHRDVARQFLANGWLRLHLLRLDGRICAALYCWAYQNRTGYYLGGFAPELGKFSLGTLLTARAIRHALDEGHSEFDFLRGSEPYKYRWQPQERINHRLLLLRSRDGLGNLGGLSAIPGRAGFALNRMERYVEHRAKAFAEQQGRRETTKSGV